MKREKLFAPVPEQPAQGDVIAWWTTHHHPDGTYVQRHRATYYANSTCQEVFGEDYVGGRAFRDEWLIETWYEPIGKKSAAGGRNTTEGLRRHFESAPSVAGWGTYATWLEARDAAIASSRAQAQDYAKKAARLEREASKLAEAATPPAERGR